MPQPTKTCLLVLALALVPGAAAAQDLEVTMDVVGPGDMPAGAVDQVIPLPVPAGEFPGQQRTERTYIQDDSRQMRRETRDQARELREYSQDQVTQMRDEARELRGQVRDRQSGGE